MKKLYTLILASVFAISANAATITIGVGCDASFAPANQFTPAAVTCAVGDVLQFVLAFGTHNVTSTSVPSGAAAMSSGTMTGSGTMYNYTVTVAGSYAYSCTFHAGMNGTATASAVGILDPTVDLLTQAYPNPFSNKLTLKYNGIESVELFNIVGEKVRTFELSATESKMELDLSDLTSGIYFYRTYKEGNIVETKKVVKK